MVWTGVSVLKKLLLSLILITKLFADDIHIEKSIYEKIFSALVTTEKPLIYSDESILSLGLRPADFTQVNECHEAEIVVMTHSSVPEYCRSKIVFGTRYRHLEVDYILGAFFWQKGRPNLLFLQEKLDEHNIVLRDSLEEYVE